MDNSAPLLTLGITAFCYLCGSYPEVNIGAFESDAGTAIRGHGSHKNQLFDAVAGVDEVPALEELELSFELAAGAELSEGLDVSLPDLASLLPFADAGFAEE
jgi:hypothetical protein